MLTPSEMPDLIDREALVAEMREGIAILKNISVHDVPEISSIDIEEAICDMNEALNEFIQELARRI